MLAARRIQFVTLTLITLSTMLSFAFSSQAAAPTNIVTYQGRLLNSNSVPVSDTSLSMRFFFYTAVTGGTCVWSNSSASCDSNTPGSTTARTVTLTSGLFTQNLGDTGDTFAAIGDSIFADNSTLFLEVIVGSETLSPRRRLTAAPYALNSQTLDGLSSADFLRDTGDTATGIFDFTGAVLSGASPLVFEGTLSDEFEATIAFTNPTVDRTITFQNASGTVAFLTDVTGGGIWETGTFVYEDDSAVVVGGDVAFTYASGGIGDLRVADQLEVLDDVFVDNDLVVGASTSSTETIANGLFSLGGNDFFAASDVGIEGALYIDGAIDLVGTATVGDLACTDCLDFTELSDTLALDASTSITIDGTESLTVTNSGTGNVAFNLSSTGDFIVQDNGSAALTVNDSGNTVLSGDLTISGDDLLMGTNTSGFLLVADGTNFNPVALSGDATLTSAGVLAIAADAVVLSTDTTGNYVATLADAGGSDFTISGSGSEGATVTIDIVADAIDFDEMSDSMSLDASTSITLSDAEALTFTNSGTGNIITNLSSTGDFVVQDSGAAVLTIADDDVLTYTTDLTTTNAASLTGNNLTTGSLLNLSATALTTGSALSVTATNANTADSLSRLSQFAFTNSQSTAANTDIAGLLVSFTNNPSVAGNTERVVSISNQATSNTTDNTVRALLAMDNADTSTTGSTVVTDAIAITVTGAIADGIVDAIDATDGNITNALNFGTNTILGTTGNIDMTNFDVVGSSGSITTSGDLAVNGDDITADGVLTLDAAATIQFGTDDDLLPQLGASDADVGATGTRWDNIFSVAGNFSGTATVGDLSCTDCLDFAELIDAMSLDASTSIALSDAETLTFTNGGTANIITNLSSTGDFVIQDNGTTILTVSDTGAITVDPTSTGTILDFELATQWTTGDLINLDWASATTATGAVTVLDIDLTNFTPDGASAFNGIRINDQAAATSSTEYGIYLEGSNWDRALYVEDISEFREDVVFDDATEGVDITIGSDNAIPLLIGADVFNGGTIIGVVYDTNEVVDSAITGMGMNLNTNLTGNAADNVTAYSGQLPGFAGNLPNSASTTTLTGFNVSGADIDTGVAAASVVQVNWRGITIDLASIDTGSADDTVQSIGLLVNGGTVTNGAGTEDQIGIDVSGTKIELDADNDTSLIASTDDRIDWELGGTLQSIIMSAPAIVNSGTTTSIFDINYATPVDTSGTNTHQGMTIDMDIGNSTAGTNSVNAIAIEAITGDEEVVSLHGIDIGTLSGTAATNETAIQIGAGWDAEISFIDTTQVDIRIVNGASLAFQDASGNEMLSLEDVGSAVNHVITTDSDTGFSFDSSADTDSDITTVSGEDLRIEPGGSGDISLIVDGDSAIDITADTAPAIDMISIANTSQATTTDGVNAVSIDFSATGASAAALFIESSYVGGATDALSYAGIFVNDINPTNAAGADTIYGIDVSTITDPGANITSAGIRINSGYDANLLFSDTTTIVDVQGGGSITFRDTLNTLMVLTDNGADGVLTIDNLSTVNATVNLYDVAVNKTIDLGGVSNDAADTVNIATNSTSGDTVAIGNSAVGTNVTLTAGGTIDLEGAVTIDLATIAATQFAVCHTNSDTNDEPIGDCSGAPTADYAEQYPVASGITFGDIVVPGSEEVTTTQGHTITKLVKSSEPYQGPIVGIVSDNFGDFTSAGYNIEAGDNPMPIALVGRVPVRVTDEGGAIAVGDYLTTSSTAGRAMKASKVGRVIGMALQNWDGVSDTVMVQVNNSWYMGEVIGTDGVSTLVTDNVVVSSFDTATAEAPTFDSYGLSLRGSAWNGSEAEAVEMMLQNVVESGDEYRLSVRNTSESEVAYITNEGTMKIAGDMVVGGNIYPSDRGVPQTEKYIYYDGSEGSAGDFIRTNAKGWSTGSYDFAEMFPSTEELVAGEVVVFSGSGHEVKRATGADTEQLAGIVSTRPGFLAGENIDGSYPIALAGRVPTRVSAASGAIAVGDPLAVTTTPGVAAKATASGQIVGYALEAYNGTESDDLILVYVNMGHWQEEQVTPVTLSQNTASQSSSTTNFSGISMSGNLSMNSYEITGISKLTGMGDSWSLASDGTLTTSGLVKTVIDSYQNEKVETVAVTSPEVMITLTGTAILENDQLEIRFEDVIPEYNDVISADAPIRVFVTPHGPVSLYVSESDQNHFVVTRFQGDIDVEFDWMVSAYRKGYEPEEEQVEESVDPGFSLGATEIPTESSSDSSVLSDPEPTEEDSASPASPDTTLIDPAIESNDGDSADPEVPSP